MIEFIALLSNVLVSRHVRFASRPANTNQTKWRHDHRFSVKTRDMANGRVAVAGHGDLGPNFLGFCGSADLDRRTGKKRCLYKILSCAIQLSMELLGNPNSSGVHTGEGLALPKQNVVGQMGVLQESPKKLHFKELHCPGCVS